MFLSIRLYSRVGLRVLFAKEYPTREAAAGALLSTGLIQPASEPVFELQSSPWVEPEVSLRKEDSKAGCWFRLKAETLKIEFQPAFGIAKYFQEKSTTKERLILDVDYYLHQAGDATRLQFDEWIKQAFHLIRRDSRKLIGA